jgi:hypothetical protein
VKPFHCNIECGHIPFLKPSVSSPLSFEFQRQSVYTPAQIDCKTYLGLPDLKMNAGANGLLSSRSPRTKAG